MKTIITIALLLVLQTHTKAQVTLSKCQSIFSNVQAAFTKGFYMYNDFRRDVAKLILGKDLGKLTDLAFDFQNELYELAGTIPGNGETSIGPRYLVIPCKNISGSLITDRTFITVPSLYDKLYITIEQTDGKSEADISVCIKNADGIVVNSKSKNLDGVGKKAEFIFFGTEDKYVSIHLVKKISVNSFSYKVSITGEINEEKEDLVKYMEEEKASDGNTSGTTNGSKPGLPSIGTGGTKLPQVGSGIKNGAYDNNTSSSTPTVGANPAVPKVSGVGVQPKPIPTSPTPKPTETTDNTEPITSPNAPKPGTLIPKTPSSPKSPLPQNSGENPLPGTDDTENDVDASTVTYGTGNGKKRLKKKAKEANQARGGTPEGEDKESLKEKAKAKKEARDAENETDTDANKKQLKKKAKQANQDRGGTPEGEDKETLKEKAKAKKAAKNGSQN